jgi:hypothetical protein
MTMMDDDGWWMMTAVEDYRYQVLNGSTDLLEDGWLAVPIRAGGVMNPSSVAIALSVSIGGKNVQRRARNYGMDACRAPELV